MPIPEKEIAENIEWIAQMRSVPADKCVLKTNDRCKRPDIKKTFMAELTLYELIFTNATLDHAFHPRVCEHCPVAQRPRTAIYRRS